MKTRTFDTRNLINDNDQQITVRKNGRTTVIKSWVVPDFPEKRVSLATLFKVKK
jgi:hypothetical protein